MVGPDCPLSVVLVALGHSTLGRAKVPALVMGCRRGGGKGHTSHSSLHLSLRGHQLTSTRPACSQDQDTRTHHDGHTGEQHSREKLPDPGGGGAKGKLQSHSPPGPQGTLYKTKHQVWGRIQSKAQ